MVFTENPYSGIFYAVFMTHSKKRVLEIVGLSHGLIKAMDVFKDFVINNFVK